MGKFSAAWTFRAETTNLVDTPCIVLRQLHHHWRDSVFLVSVPNK